MAAWEAVIGLEVHAQLLTRSKMFCRCSADYASAPPNTHVCPVCLGLPGALPVLNRHAVELTIRTGLAMGSQIAEFCRFDRKNYFYPDLMKGYQISQYDRPLCAGGELAFAVGDDERRAGITRVHLEEDTAKHTDRAGYSLIDVNRGGVPLIEIVGEPDLRSPNDAREFLRALRGVLRHVGASTGSMEDGAFRCDANVSVRPLGTTAFGTKVEVKNMNSFRAVYNALRYEVERQSKAIEAGERITQETRGWDDTRGVTLPQRSKEYAHDYRYFPEPDLPPLAPPRDWVEQIRDALPELPEARRARYQGEQGLSVYDATRIAAEREYAELFDRTVAAYNQPKIVANWLIGDVRRLAGTTPIEESRLTPDSFAELLHMVECGDLNRAGGQQVLEALYAEGGTAKAAAAAHGLQQVSDESALLAAIDAAIAGNPKVVEDYRSGKKAAAGFLVGQVMKTTRGQANPGLLNQLLARRLDA